jgi:hypothetical protein
VSEARYSRRDGRGTNGWGDPRRLAVLLAMAMLVLVVDTSLMNVSISAVIRDLHTTASGVQSAIALEALDEIIRINTESRHIALQVGLLIPILAGLLGFVASLRMMRLPDPVSSSAAEGMALG